MQETSGLLKLFNTRYRLVISKLPDQYRVPKQDRHRVQMAIAEYAKWHESDPFAKVRIAKALARGYELASDVYKDYHRRNLVREMNRRKKQLEQL